MPRKKFAINEARLTELWNREPQLMLKTIAEELSTSDRTFRPQTVSMYAHHLGLPKRKEYTTRAPVPARKNNKHRSPSTRGARARCPQCYAQFPVDKAAQHTCPDARMVAAAFKAYTGRPFIP